MNPEFVVVNVKFNPENNAIELGSNLPQDMGVVGRLAMQQVMQKAINALDKTGQKPKNNIIVPEPVMQ